MKKISYKVASIAILAVLVVSGGLFAYFQLRGDSPKDAASEDKDEEGFKINYDPPTKEEQQAGDNRKQEIASEEDQPAEPSGSADVVITDANQYDNQIEVRALVSNIIEAGTCTVSFTKGSKVIEKQVPALEDASTTQCKTLIVPRSEFPSGGEWTVKVVYRSNSSSGETQRKIEVK